MHLCPIVNVLDRVMERVRAEIDATGLPLPPKTVHRPTP
jgi:hypothetical protein